MIRVQGIWMIRVQGRRSLLPAVYATLDLCTSSRSTYSGTRTWATARRFSSRGTYQGPSRIVTWARLLATGELTSELERRYRWCDARPGTDEIRGLRCRRLCERSARTARASCELKHEILLDNCATQTKSPHLQRSLDCRTK